MRRQLQKMQETRPNLANPAKWQVDICIRNNDGQNVWLAKCERQLLLV